MKAAVHDRYGPPEVMRVEEVEKPVPQENEVLVRVRAAGITRTDAGYRAAHPFITRFLTGLRRPKRRILGSEFAGDVEATGSAVSGFSVGDRVFGGTGFNLGTQAEYVCVRHTGRIAHLPASIIYEEGASICEGALYALNTLRSANLQRGQRILVYGASGAIGSASVQLAKHLGAHVTGVCSTRNVELVRSFGVDRVIDYTQEDFTRAGDTYDVIHDAVGKHSFFRCRRALAPRGIYIANDLGYLCQVPPLALLTARTGGQRVMFPLGTATQKDVLLLKDLLEVGDYRPVLDRTYPLEQVVEAARYVDTGRKRGNVVLTLD
jgi:NADPH:quinone reductase-like Zn-dependent oxidoreductase